jgi:hypothetical protein
MGNNEFKDQVVIQETDMYQDDLRQSLGELQKSYDKLLDFGWQKEIICTQTEINPEGEILSYPIYGYLSQPKNTKAEESLWIISGIHGEEPAGPNALAKEIETLKSLSKDNIPMVMIPVMNPLGYSKDYRFWNSRRDSRHAQFIADPDHLLLDKANPNKPRREKPTNAYSEQILNWVVEKMYKFPPYLVVDHHEDELEWETKAVDLEGSYCYAYGNPEVIESSCKKIAQTLNKHGVPLLDNFETRYHERTSFGFLFNTSDGSIDEFLAVPSFYWEGKRQLKPAAKAVFVIETTRDDAKPIPLIDREKAHQEIIKSYRALWDLVHLSSHAL